MPAGTSNRPPASAARRRDLTRSAVAVSTTHTLLTPPPLLVAMTQVHCHAGALVTLAPGPHGERRCVPLGGGTVVGPESNGMLVEGGADWQVNRADGVLDIAAHCVIRADDGGPIEVQSNGLRHGPPAAMAQLAHAEAVSPEACYFRTAVRFTTGAPARPPGSAATTASAWHHLPVSLALMSWPTPLLTNW